MMLRHYKIPRYTVPGEANTMMVAAATVDVLIRTMPEAHWVRRNQAAGKSRIVAMANMIVWHTASSNRNACLEIIEQQLYRNHSSDHIVPKLTCIYAMTVHSTLKGSLFPTLTSRSVKP